LCITASPVVVPKQMTSSQESNAVTATTAASQTMSIAPSSSSSSSSELSKKSLEEEEYEKCVQKYETEMQSIENQLVDEHKQFRKETLSKIVDKWNAELSQEDVKKRSAITLEVRSLTKEIIEQCNRRQFVQQSKSAAAQEIIVTRNPERENKFGPRSVYAKRDFRIGDIGGVDHPITNRIAGGHRRRDANETHDTKAQNTTATTKPVTDKQSDDVWISIYTAIQGAVAEECLSNTVAAAQLHPAVQPVASNFIGCMFSNAEKIILCIILDQARGFLSSSSSSAAAAASKGDDDGDQKTTAAAATTTTTAVEAENDDNSSKEKEHEANKQQTSAEILKGVNVDTCQLTCAVVDAWFKSHGMTMRRTKLLPPVEKELKKRRWNEARRRIFEYFTVYETIVEHPGLFKHAYGLALYPVLGMFNHSCQPNCLAEFSSDGMVRLRVVDMIPPGTEMTICYSNELLWRPRNDVNPFRLKDMKSVLPRLQFTCFCEYCEHIAEQQKLSQEQEEKAKASRQKGAAVPTTPASADATAAARNGNNKKKRKEEKKKKKNQTNGQEPSVPSSTSSSPPPPPLKEFVAATTETVASDDAAAEPREAPQKQQPAPPPSTPMIHNAIPMLNLWDPLDSDHLTARIIQDHQKAIEEALKLPDDKRPHENIMRIILHLFLLLKGTIDASVKMADDERISVVKDNASKIVEQWKAEKAHSEMKLKNLQSQTIVDDDDKKHNNNEETNGDGKDNPEKHVIDEGSAAAAASLLETLKGFDKLKKIEDPGFSQRMLRQLGLVSDTKIREFLKLRNPKKTKISQDEVDRECERHKSLFSDTKFNQWRIELFSNIRQRVVDFYSGLLASSVLSIPRERFMMPTGKGAHPMCPDGKTPYVLARATGPELHTNYAIECLIALLKSDKHVDNINAAPSSKIEKTFTICKAIVVLYGIIRKTPRGFDWLVANSYFVDEYSWPSKFGPAAHMWEYNFKMGRLSKSNLRAAFFDVVLDNLKHVQNLQEWVSKFGISSLDDCMHREDLLTALGAFHRIFPHQGLLLYETRQMNQKLIEYEKEQMKLDAEFQYRRALASQDVLKLMFPEAVADIDATVEQAKQKRLAAAAAANGGDDGDEKSKNPNGDDDGDGKEEQQENETNRGPVDIHQQLAESTDPDVQAILKAIREFDAKLVLEQQQQQTEQQQQEETSTLASTAS
jgi:hypothetical protein